MFLLMHNTYVWPHWSRREEDRWREGEEYDERENNYDHHHDSDHARGGRNPRFFRNNRAPPFRPRSYRRPQYQESNTSFHEGGSHFRIRDYPTSHHQHRYNRATFDMGQKREKSNSTDGSSTQGRTRKVNL